MKLKQGLLRRKKEKKQKRWNEQNTRSCFSVFFFLSGADPLPHPSAFTGSFFFCSHKHKHTHTTKNKKDSTFFLFLFISLFLCVDSNYFRSSEQNTHIHKKKIDNSPETRAFEAFSVTSCTSFSCSSSMITKSYRGGGGRESAWRLNVCCYGAT